MNGRRTAGAPSMTPSPSLWGLGAGAVMLAAVIYLRTRALHASQLVLSFNICAHIAPAQPAAASSARISGRQAGSVSGGLPIRLVRSAMVSGAQMFGAASVELGGPTDLLAPNGRAPKMLRALFWVVAYAVYMVHVIFAS